MNIEANLRLRHVRVFLEVARVESVSAAATTLNVTQPAVSRAIKELEQILDAPLFDRVGRGLRLNEAGRIFQVHAKASMVELLRGRDRLTRAEAGTRRISVGVLPTAATDLLPRAAIAFQQEMPHVQLRVTTGPNWLLFNQLRDGQLDMVVGRMPEADAATGLTFRQLYIEDVVLIARPNHPIHNAPRPRLALAGYPLILPPSGAVIAATVQRYLASVELADIKAAVETVALPVGRKMVQLSDALWFISRGVVADELAQSRLVSVDLVSPLLSGPVGITMAQSAPISVERSVLTECLHAVLETADRT